MTVLNDMKALPQWVVWKLQERDGKKTKIPYQLNRKKAKTSDSTTWCSYEDAIGANGFDGVGFVFTEDCGIIGIDFDHCLDSRGELIDNRYEMLIQALRSEEAFIEISPSGDGLHAYYSGSLSFESNKLKFDNGTAIEVYKTGRYFTFTQYEWNGGNPFITAGSVQSELDSILGIPSVHPEKSSGTQERGNGISVQEIIEKMKAHNQYPDAPKTGDDWSALDLTFVTRLAYWTQGDIELIDEVFRTSPLYRDKWERVDYRDRTISKALQGTTSHPSDYINAKNGESLPSIREEFENHQEEFLYSLFGCRNKEDYYVRPLPAEKIKHTPFYRNVINLVYAPSGQGKSMTVAKLIEESAERCIWLDKDHNVNSDLLDILDSSKRFTHVNKNVNELYESIKKGKNADGLIVVLDSLKDFAGRYDLDSNAGSQSVMEDIRELLEVNVTVIIIAHATWSNENGKRTDFKMKGNDETIISKSDVVYKLTHVSNERLFKCEKNRVGSKASFKVPEALMEVQHVQVA